MERRRMRQTTIKCDHCNRDITKNYGAKQLQVRVEISALTCYNRREQSFGRTLEVCEDCAQKFKDMMTAWIKTK